MTTSSVIAGGLTALVVVASVATAKPADLAATRIRLEVDERLHTRLVVGTVEDERPGKERSLGEFAPSEAVWVGGRLLEDFAGGPAKTGAHVDHRGRGRFAEYVGVAGSLGKRVRVLSFDDFPRLVVLRVQYENRGKIPLVVEGWFSRRFLPAAGGGPAPAFWSYQSAAYESRPDWVLPLSPGFSRKNDLGMNASDYGGGTPLAAVWRRDLGLAVAHLAPHPLLLSMPVAMRDARGVFLGLEQKSETTLAPGESLKTPEILVTVFHGDYYQALVAYRRLMEKAGVRFSPPPASAYDPIWCAWGYGRAGTPEHIYETLPKAAALGFRWAAVDDGWQVAEGDWTPAPKKFPRGDADMRALTDRIRSFGLRPMLWWAPLAADPGTRLLERHPDFLLHGPDGKPQAISWWDAHYLCPAYPPVVAHSRDLVTTILGPWGFEGLKLDGQHLNAAPPCHNPAHGHASTHEAYQKTPDFFRALSEAAQKVRPGALLELCPCGTGYSFFSMPYFAMPAASDPESSWQIRTKAKTLKALMGENVPFFGDHVELSDGGLDFASTVGVGGVPGSQFTLPGVGRSEKKYRLTPAKERVFVKWLRLYQEKRLAQGRYRGELYDIGFDRPEAHAIEKDGRLTYAFFARRHRGPIELRGLGQGAYCLSDYENRRPLGEVTGPVATVPASFSGHLLLEAQPKAPEAHCPAGGRDSRR